jgi:DNA-binding transcriptional ArsR family regulator
METPHLIWDRGTAYDLFVSLMVIHKPTEFNLRPAWAAGMRSRLPAADREFLELLYKAELLYPPFCWLHSLPDPKDGKTVIDVLEQIPLHARLETLTMCSDSTEKSQLRAILSDVASRGTWDAGDQAEIEQIIAAEYQRHGESPTAARKAVPYRLDLWSQTEETGKRWLRALRSYYEVFFVEEERRIGPALDLAIANAQEIAERTNSVALLEELSQGVQFNSEILECEELILVPTYWCSPLVLYDRINPRTTVITFGARPASDSLVPGEAVPDALVVVLKALSDPTRLRIIRYLKEEELTPSQLARSLRLRPPTVIHHLTTLRMAGLVQVSLTQGKEKSYAARNKAINAALETLRQFLE